ncbi:MAG: RelA/SpoT domain-containing protein [Dermatophilaceae bacterium]
MPLPISRSALDALGKRLRADDVSDADWQLLQDVLDCYQAALDAAQEQLAELGLSSTSRVKSTGTLVDKLSRGTSFKSVQDVAGARIVVSGGLDEQDAAVTLIVGCFGASSRVVDRRTEPMHGYRAVHLIVTCDGLPVEVQVRTAPQDMWAQAMERLADRWGREVRYREPLAGADIEVAPNVTRGDLLGLVCHLGVGIALLEDLRKKAKFDHVVSEEHRLRLDHDLRHAFDGVRRHVADTVSDVKRRADEVLREITVALARIDELTG